ncbi:MAG: D-2-hydroxyacid dehydrogenase [Acidimicrobiaceae bacterium]|nr:D-2-hydroxyacid dehydrogenase [Acidimicrobiaceae bacterium]
MPLTVLMTGNVPEAGLRGLREAHPDIDFRYFDDVTDLEAHIEEADVVAGEISEAAFRRATRLRWQHSWAAGVDRSLFPSMVDSDIPFTCSKGNGAVPLAEHALLLMLMLTGGAVGLLDAQRAHSWAHFRHRELYGQSVGLVGLGNSGLHLARVARALGMRTLGFRRSDRPSPDVDEMFSAATFKRFLGESDFVVVTAPITAATHHLFDEDAFRAMKPSAFWICVSRGGIADDDALLRAVREGWIAGAGIDAHEIEPLPADSPFWDEPNVIVTPHNGAASPMTSVRGFRIFEENLGHFLAGEPLVNVVDKREGY